MLSAPALFSPEDAAVYLAMSRTGVYALIKQGRLQARRFGKRTLIERAELDRFVATLALAAMAEPAALRRAREADAEAEGGRQTA